MSIDMKCPSCKTQLEVPEQIDKKNNKNFYFKFVTCSNCKIKVVAQYNNWKVSSLELVKE